LSLEVFTTFRIHYGVFCTQYHVGMVKITEVSEDLTSLFRVKAAPKRPQFHCHDTVLHPKDFKITHFSRPL